jgi:hypothetical protein
MKDGVRTLIRESVVSAFDGEIFMRQRAPVCGPEGRLMHGESAHRLKLLREAGTIAIIGGPLLYWR